MATFGNTVEGSGGITTNTSVLYASDLFYIAEFIGKGVSMSLYCKVSSGGPINIQMALYDSTGNLVTNGITETVAISGGTSTWYTANFVIPPSISAVQYRLVCWLNCDVSNVGVILATSNVKKFQYQVGLTFPNWPSTISLSDSIISGEFCIYCTYTPSSTIQGIQTIQGINTIQF